MKKTPTEVNPVEEKHPEPSESWLGWEAIGKATVWIAACILIAWTGGLVVSLVGAMIDDHKTIEGVRSEFYKNLNVQDEKNAAYDGKFSSLSDRLDKLENPTKPVTNNVSVRAVELSAFLTAVGTCTNYSVGGFPIPCISITNDPTPHHWRN